MLTQAFAEILLLIPAVLTTGFVLFVAGVLQSVMEDADAAGFKRFLTALTRHALKSPYAIAVSTLTFLGMFPYWYLYGFGNLWFSAGLILWVIASIVSKYTVLPIYTRVTGREFPGFRKLPVLKATDVAGLEEERRKLHRANLLRAGLCSASVVLMVLGMG